MYWGEAQCVLISTIIAVIAFIDSIKRLESHYPGDLRNYKPLLLFSGLRQIRLRTMSSGHTERIELWAGERRMEREKKRVRDRERVENREGEQGSRERERERPGEISSSELRFPFQLCSSVACRSPWRSAIPFRIQPLHRGLFKLSTEASAAQKKQERTVKWTQGLLWQPGVSWRQDKAQSRGVASHCTSHHNALRYTVHREEHRLQRGERNTQQKASVWDLLQSWFLISHFSLNCEPVSEQ